MLHLEIQEVIVEMVNIYYIITVCVNVHQDRGQLLEFLNQKITQIGYIIVVNMQILDMTVISLNGNPLKDLVIATPTKNHKRLFKEECMSWMKSLNIF